MGTKFNEVYKQSLRITADLNKRLRNTKEEYKLFLEEILQAIDNLPKETVKQKLKSKILELD